ncbi:MAG: phosphoribosylamine--glycine ligase [Lachnospiraceae bacterium]|nr:phosphoribosylamine--glycine ligase [Lachnospiraceae bacterium]
MNVLVVGSGGREHAIVKGLLKSKGLDSLYCAPGNAGIALDCECVDIKAMDFDGLADFAEKNDIGLTVIGMDDPLIGGITDVFEARGLKVFGPRKNAAVLEGSKAFSKELMTKYNIPTGDYRVFDNADEALSYLDSCKIPVVVKADGPALGKGVLICGSKDEAADAVKVIMRDKKFGDSGNRVVIEEFLTGPEVSVLTFTDGKTIRVMSSSQDYKKAYSGNKGPNTGGMGNYSPVPFFTPDVERYCMEKIFKPTVDAMASEGRPFSGVIFFGLMITEDGPRVLEYNARFGDPETQVIIPRMKNDLLEVFLACAESRLSEIELEFTDEAAVCVVLASSGYPVSYEKGFSITGLDKASEMEGVSVFHAGTGKEGNNIVTNGGRVLGVTALGPDIEAARKKAYEAASCISFNNKYMRNDIAADITRETLWKMG